MARIEDVNFGPRHVAAIGLWLRKLERQFVLAPKDEKVRLLLAHPCLPLGIRLDTRAVVIEQVALNVGLAGLQIFHFCLRRIAEIADGAGRTMFDGVKERLNLKLTTSRSFSNEVYCSAIRRETKTSSEMRVAIFVTVARQWPGQRKVS